MIGKRAVRVLQITVAAGCVLLAGCSNAMNTGPFGDGGGQTSECMPVLSGQVVSYGFTEFRNKGSATGVITRLDLDHGHGIKILAAYIVPVTGHNLYGIWLGYPPTAHIPAGVQWARRQRADGARIPPWSQAKIMNNILLVLGRTAKNGTAHGVNVYYTEAGQHYHLRTNSTITLKASNSC